MQLSQKEKTFSQFFFAFLKSILNYQHLPKKQKTLIADVFPEIPAPKNIVSKMSKKPCFRGPLDRQRRKCIETLLQSEWQNLYNNYLSPSREMHWEMSLLVIHKILRLCVNTLTVDDTHYLVKRDNLTRPIQIQLSEKQKTFTQFFFCIFKIYIRL